MKKAILVALLVLTILGVVFITNYLSVDSPVQKMLASDVRNAGIELTAHYEYYIKPGILILDLKNVNGSKADVFRSVWQSAAALKDNRFDTVVLAHQGTPKFKLAGDYFQELGGEYDIEKPMYVLRTFSENVLNTDGSKAYGGHYGGILGVLSSELDDFNSFANKWYIDSDK